MLSDPEEACQLKQIHSNIIYEIHSSQDLAQVRGKEGDGLLSYLPNRPLLIKTADCVPILLAHPQGIIGALHAGWRGSSQQILSLALKKIEALSLDLKEVKLWIGPAIAFSCYEVGEEVAKHFPEAVFGPCLRPAKSPGKYYLGLQEANYYLALKAGVPKSNLYLSPHCTFCEPQDYYSYRWAKQNHKEETARNHSWIVFN
ncbi:MAG: polyphenol oxidase family protein [Deltaproteobacteria bacterium]|nr:polyphenol oxidase family protein [Deltaproteobacteria bacterium]